jgi:pSer/pThr/pTyr-binding forkhead associated (FHA) protein
MPVITVNDQPYALTPGQNRLGEGPDVDIHVGSYPALGVQAIIDVGDGHPVITRATPLATVRVNGVLLIDPTPLMHGDKIEIAGRELLFSDDAKAGATRTISAREVAAIAAAPSAPAARSSRSALSSLTTPGGSARPVVTTGGRLVSLVDGKEYAVGDEGLTIGRDASSAVVVAQDDVSRRHAIVLHVDGGFEIRDLSVNGVKVNGVRVDNSRRLAQSDVIQVGSEEFRFHTDLVPSRAPSGSSALRSFLGAGPSDAPPTLAILTVSNSGPANGRKYEVRVPLASIGRGAHNDVSIDDSSISDSHAKLQYREHTWFITDLGSRNGTYVGGVRFTGERRLYGNVELRIGNVKLMFRPTGVVPPTPKDSRIVAGGERAALSTVQSPSASPAAATSNAAPRQGPAPWMWSIVVVAMLAVAALFLLNP